MTSKLSKWQGLAVSGLCLGLVANLSLPLTYAVGLDDFQVTVSSPFTITSGQPTFAFPTLHQSSSNSNDLMLAVWSAPDDYLTLENRRQTVVHTSDGGQSWDAPQVLTGIASGGHSSAHLSDGTNLWLGYFNDLTISSNVLSTSVGKSTNGVDYSWTNGNVTFPQPIKRSSNPAIPTMMFARSIVELNDNSLLATMYGEFESDTTYRSVVVRSTDGGVNWNYQSTIAYDANAPYEGYDEPVIERTANGDLLCVMRTSSYSPLQLSRSQDEGLTWSDPAPLPNSQTGVFPDLLLMSNGVLALSFGRPGSGLMFSLDGNGETWTTPTTIYTPDPVATCGYTAIEEVSPGRLLSIYSYFEYQQNPNALSSIRGVFVDAVFTPEPATNSLMLMASTGLIGFRRRRPC